MLRAVTFDLWSTLLADNERQLYPARCDIMSRMLANAGCSVDPADLDEAFDECWKHFKVRWRKRHVTMSAANMVARISSRFCPRVPDETFRGAVEEMETLSLSVPPALVEGTMETLEALFAMDPPMKMAIISDTGFTPGRIVRKVLENLGISRFFSHMVFSDEIGKAKPVKGNFIEALEALGVAAHEAAHVGDIEETDVRGSRGAGMTSVLFTGGKMRVYGRSEADFIIPSLSLVCDIAGRLRGTGSGQFHLLEE